MTTGEAGLAAPLVRAAVIIITLVAALGTPADADLWGHLTFGRDIVAAGQVHQHDQYSFTSDKPWINHEWLAEAVFFVAYRAAGPSGLIVLKVTFIGLLMWVLWWRLAQCGATLDARILLLFLAFVGTYWRMHNVRPQIFSVVLFACLLVIVTIVDAGRRRALWLVPLLFALWVNLHGGYIVGLGMLGLWVLFSLADKRLSTESRVSIVGPAALSIVATLVNPYGIRLWLMLAETVRLDRADIQDWSPLSGFPIALGVPWAITALAAVIGIREMGWRNRLSCTAITAVLGLASIRVGRLDAFFSISVLVLLAPGLIAATHRLLTRFSGASAPRPRLTGEVVGFRTITVLAIVGMLIAAAPYLRRYATCMPMDDGWLPEPEVAEFVARNQLRGRMLTFFDWGQYAVWYFAPQLKVSMDGRRETVYSDDVIWSHWRFYAAEAGATSYLHSLAPDYIWVPKQRPIAHQMSGTGWRPIFDGPVSVIFAPSSSQSFQQVAPAVRGPRCFPGP